jgi:sec-independent protein translocase protein TatA
MIADLLQPMHLVVIALVAVLFFGPGKLAELGKGLGEGIKNFKTGIKEAADAAKDGAKTE